MTLALVLLIISTLYASTGRYKLLTLRVWKPSEKKMCENRSMVRDKVEEAEWKCLNVNEHW